jgi:hypothetical protein
MKVRSLRKRLQCGRTNLKILIDSNSSNKINNKINDKSSKYSNNSNDILLMIINLIISILSYIQKILEADRKIY